MSEALRLKVRPSGRARTADANPPKTTLPSQARRQTRDRLAVMTTAPTASRAAHPAIVGALWALATLWAGVIFAFSAQPGNRIPGRFSEVGHLGEYFVFGALLCAALRASGQRKNAAAIAVIVASIYGMTDEFHQHFVFMRTPDVVDWALDTLGASLGATVTTLMTRRLAGRGRARTDPADQ
jgi:VanZ family protein